MILLQPQVPDFLNVLNKWRVSPRTDVFWVGYLTSSLIFENSWCKAWYIRSLPALSFFEKESGIPPTLVSSSRSNVLHKCCCIQYDTGWRPYTCNLKNSLEFSTREIGWTMEARDFVCDNFLLLCEFFGKIWFFSVKCDFSAKTSFLLQKKKIDMKRTATAK